MDKLNISRAKKVTIDINDYDPIPLTLAYVDSSDPAHPIPIDLRTYGFSFDFKQGQTATAKKNYSLPPAGSSDFLSITGDDHNILDMTLMWADIKANQTTFNGQYRLIQLVTDNNGYSFVHLIYYVNADRD